MSLPNRLGIATVLFVILALTGAAMLSMTGVGAQETGDAGSNVTVDDAGSNVTITVSATGASSASPDLAVVDVAVEASAGSADAARGAVAENASEMRDRLTEANISDDQIRTTYFFIQTERDDNGTVTYRAAQGFELRVPADDAGSTVDAAVAGGATRVDGVRFTLSEETSRELRNDALEGAITNARTDADVIAGATDTEVTAVKSVETANEGVGSVFEDADDQEGTTFDPGPVTVTARVTVTYEAS